jgi:preprotein translocase SecE subunit
VARDRKRSRERRERVGRGQGKAGDAARSSERAGAKARAQDAHSAVAVGSAAAAASGIPTGTAALPESFLAPGPEGREEPGLPAEPAAEPAPEAGSLAQAEPDDGDPREEQRGGAGGAVLLDGDSAGGVGLDDLQEDEREERRYGFGRSLPGRTSARPGGRPARGSEQSLLDRTSAFLRASWAELQRMQWPDRRQTSQATAVVLGFVVVAGVYLGVADWVAQKIVNLIL